MWITYEFHSKSILSNSIWTIGIFAVWINFIVVFELWNKLSEANNCEQNWIRDGSLWSSTFLAPATTETAAECRKENMAESFHGLDDGKDYELVIGSSFRQKQNEDFYHTIKCKRIFTYTETSFSKIPSWLPWDYLWKIQNNFAPNHQSVTDQHTKRYPL